MFDFDKVDYRFQILL